MPPRFFKIRLMRHHTTEGGERKESLRKKRVRESLRFSCEKKGSFGRRKCVTLGNRREEVNEIVVVTEEKESTGSKYLRMGENRSRHGGGEPGYQSVQGD